VPSPLGTQRQCREILRGMQSPVCSVFLVLPRFRSIVYCGSLFSSGSCGFELSSDDRESWLELCPSRPNRLEASRARRSC
jgi:hypothetical protein